MAESYGRRASPPRRMRSTSTHRGGPQRRFCADPGHQRRRRARPGHRRAGARGRRRPATTSSSSPRSSTTAAPARRWARCTPAPAWTTRPTPSRAWATSPTYGIDGPPALAVILACVGGFGPRPDIVLSGINHGVNVGRSAMHSGTVGAALTAAHFGLRCLAVSIRWGDDPVPWETPATMAGALVPVLEQAPAGTTLNLNVPNVALGELRGLRHGRLGRGGTIRSAVHVTGDDDTPLPHVALPPGQTGTLRLDLTAPGSSTPGASRHRRRAARSGLRVVDGAGRGARGGRRVRRRGRRRARGALCRGGGHARAGSRRRGLRLSRRSRRTTPGRVSRDRRSRSRASRSSGTGSGRARDASAHRRPCTPSTGRRGVSRSVTEGPDGTLGVVGVMGPKRYRRVPRRRGPDFEPISDRASKSPPGVLEDRRNPRSVRRSAGHPRSVTGVRTRPPEAG